MNHPTFPLSNPRSASRRWIGAACVLCFAGALAFLAIWSGGWLQAREEFVVRLNGTTELNKSSPVLLLGQPVGRVAALAVVAEAGQPQVEVRFFVEGEHLDWMREGSTLTVESSLVGSPWLVLHPGPAGSARLAAGSTVGGTIDAGMMARVMELQPVVENLITQIDTLVGTLNSTVQRLDPILAQVEAQLGTTQQALNEVTSLVQTTHQLFEQIKTDETALVGGVTTMMTRMNDDLLPGLEQLLTESRGMLAGTFGELDDTLDVVQARLPGLLETTQETLANTRDITEAAKHSWLFRGYWKRKAKEEAEAAKRAAAGSG